MFDADGELTGSRKGCS